MKPNPNRNSNPIEYWQRINSVTIIIGSDRRSDCKVEKNGHALNPARPSSLKAGPARPKNRPGQEDVIWSYINQTQ